jgi:hypothetical protein
MQAIEDLWITDVPTTVIATRGGHLTLMRARYSGRDQGPEVYLTEFLGVIEIDTDDRISSLVVFDPDDVDAAFEELDARYLAGEPAAHSQTWSLVTSAHATLKRHEIPPTTSDWVNIDHRRATAFASGDMAPYVRAVWDIAPDTSMHIEAVHRLTKLGAVFTYVASACTQDGFDAEWREISALTFEGDRINRCELFDETDIDTALARFDELSRPAPRLENAASRVGERYFEQLVAGDWDAITDLVADNFSQDDRRPVVGAGVRHGLDAQVSDMRAFAELSIAIVTPTVIATRGERLVLSRVRFSFSDQGSQAYLTEVIGVGEINTDGKITAAIAFDPDDIDAAFEELDARYVAGEAAPHAHTWSVIATGYAGFNRRELLATPPDWVNIDHRRGAAFAPGDMIAYIQAAWDDSPDTKIYIAAVHRLSNLGAVVTHVAHGISQEGFDAEWRDIHVLTVEGDTLGRSELFDDGDIDAALVTFDQLSNPARPLENAASRVSDRLLVSFATRDWATMSALLADDFYGDDRRQVMNVGLHGRDAVIESYRTAAEFGIPDAMTTVLATRAERLALAGVQYFVSNEEPDAFHIDLLQVVEIDGGERISGIVTFDPDDIDAAIEELDARYLAGEAAEHSHTWSLIARTCAAFNRHVMPPTTPDWINVDHRKVTAFAPGDMTAYMRATFGVAPDIRFYIEAVHRLTDLGAVFTQAGRGISHEGFEAEWRDVVLMSIEGDQFNRCEVFDEVDIDAALARFDEFSGPAP